MKRLLTISIILFLSITSILGQNIVINEFMSKNDITIQDKDGDYSDWIELYNSTNTPINLLNYSLSDDYSEIDKWIFPNITILPHSYLLIFTSDKNIFDTTELHTNFKISASGEELYLANNLGFIIDQTISISLSSDDSYARIPDASSNWVSVNTPSPNYSNNSSNQLIFSHQEGLYTSPFSLKINSSLADTIYYTLNGDIPTENSSIFIDSLFINYKNSQANIISEIPTSPAQEIISYKAWEAPSQLIHKASILRCATYNNGVRTSGIYNKTFFVDNEIINKYKVPIISLITDANNLFNSDSGLFVPGVNYDSSDPEFTGNYFMHGDNWERDVHIEYFRNDGTLCFSQDAGIRIHGGKTRQASQKSLRLYARNEYGEKYFNYNLFPQRQVNQYKRFILRTTMGAWGGQTIIADALAQNISSSLNIDYQDFQPVIVFINGEYWGIHTIRDRIDERYIEYTHNIDHESVEFMEDNDVDYNILMDFIKNNDLVFNSNYEYVITQIDIDNYIDYTIAELFFNNYDWPANNMKLWREKPNGKWRWVLYDLDACFGDENNNMFDHSTLNDNSISWPNSPESTFLFRNLLKNDKFQQQFIKRYAEILNTDYNYAIMTNKLDSIKKLYNYVISDHITRWNYPNSVNSWYDDIDNNLLNFTDKRPCIIRDQIIDFFSLSSFDFECDKDLDFSDNLILAPNPNYGNFFIFNNFFDIVNATIIITNINGQILYSEQDINLMKNEKKYFDLSYLPNNTYILQIISTNYSLQKKIILL